MEDKPAGTGAFGLTIFLSSLGMLFAATLLGYLVIRFRAPQWPPAGVPGLPGILAFNTLLLVVSSVMAQSALGAARAQKEPALHRAILATFALGIVFLALQAVAWSQMMPAIAAIGQRSTVPLGRPAVDPAPRQFAALFFTLTILHALHVLGGLVAWGLLLNRKLAFQRPRLVLTRVRHAVVYWHFLDVVWVLMYIVLLI